MCIGKAAWKMLSNATTDHYCNYFRQKIFNKHSATREGNQSYKIVIKIGNMFPYFFPSYLQMYYYMYIQAFVEIFVLPT
jgi:hypothetical protein